MSWFDTKGLANLAKTALKEAQKKIDQALDIDPQQKDDLTVPTEAVPSASVAGTRVPSVNEMRTKRKYPSGGNFGKHEGYNTEPEEVVRGKMADATEVLEDHALINTIVVESSNIAGRSGVKPLATSAWGSFTGSFFENPKANEMITTPPRASYSANSSSATTDFASLSNRPSITSTSNSIELLSPTTPLSSEEATPSEVMGMSDSVELLTAPTSTLDGLSVPLSASPSLPDSIVIIASNKEDDSFSNSTMINENEPNAIAASCDSSRHLAISAEDTSSADANPATINTRSLQHRGSVEPHTIDSDSTQSFEDIQIYSISLHEMSATMSQLPSSDKLGDSMVKIPSQGFPSPPTSHDELETATSSDIEIISNPNGDSSSTNSAHTRTTTSHRLKKGKTTSLGKPPLPSTGSSSKKGHCRELSEISILSEDSQSELDKLLQRISELNGVLETRELLLAETERRQVALQERNAELQKLLDAVKGNVAADLFTTADEYTQHVSVLEKKFQTSIRERDALRIQLAANKEQMNSHVPREQLDSVVGQKDAMIEVLRLEGEKMSREVLQQSNIIKKLRTKEKNTDSALKRAKEEIAVQADELERLKRTLHAKEEVERSQIDTVHRLSAEKRAQLAEIAKLHSRLEDTQTALSTLQSNFDAIKIELQLRMRAQTELHRTAEEAAAAREQQERTLTENVGMQMQLQEVHEKLRTAEQMASRREQQLHEDNRALLRRLENAELRAETSTQEVSLTTVPLMRQLEALQQTLAQRTSNWNKEQQQLLSQLGNAHARLRSLETVEATYDRTMGEEQARCVVLEEHLSEARKQQEKAELAAQQSQLEHSLTEAKLAREIVSLTDSIEEARRDTAALQEMNRVLEHEAHHLKAELEAYRGGVRAAVQLNDDAQQPAHRTLSIAAVTEMNEQREVAHSPVASIDANSLEDAIGGSCLDWQPIDDLDCISNSGRHMSSLAYGMNLQMLGHNSASTLEHLQSLLKQRDGESSHQQWELARVNAERSALSGELAHLTEQVENLKEKLQSHEDLTMNFADLQHRYDALLQMYGEKVERTEELELDLVELKDAYKTQISELLGSQRSSR